MGGRSHRCPACGKQFLAKPSLKEHIRQAHPDYYAVMDKQAFAAAATIGWGEWQSKPGSRND